MRLLTILLGFAAITGTGSAFQMTQQPDPLVWVPFPANHWPQEPDGLNGMKFDATRSETEKVIKLENCEKMKVPVASLQIMMGDNFSCRASLEVAGRNFKGDIVFVVGHNAVTGAPVGEGTLSSISCTFDTADYPAVKAAFIKMYGQPHQIDTPASLLVKAMASVVSHKLVE